MNHRPAIHWLIKLRFHVLPSLLCQFVLGVIWKERNPFAGAFTIAACVFGLQFLPYGGIVLDAAILTFIGRQMS